MTGNEGLVFNCPICKREWNCARADYHIYAERDYECNLCYSVIAKKRYPVNLKGTTTFFSPLGNGLGDKIVQEVILRKYKEDNPDENFLIPEHGFMNTADYLWKNKPTKIFWSDLSQFNKVPDRPYYWFSMTNEASVYASMGIYPEWHDYKKPNMEVPKDYIVMHLRNINKCKNMGKNVDEYTASKMIEKLKNKKVMLVGNDMKYPNLEQEILANKNLMDLRWKLDLNEIAWLCKYCTYFIGHDSGLTHLAAASGVRVKAFGFTDQRWFPKAPPENLQCIIKQESTIEKVLEMIE